MLFDKLLNHKLILASQSPRRQFLMQEAGFRFEVVNPNHENEDFPENIPLTEIAAFLAEKKAASFETKLKSDEIVITADTIVIFENEILGKPNGQQQAFEMLKKLSGKTHIVITGVCLLSQQKKHVFSETTQVTFRKLADEEIWFYIQNYQPFDKAGSYGAQDWIGIIGIEKIQGSFFNVMGLPINLLYVELYKFING